MTYQIRGLDPGSFRHLFGLADDALARAGAIRLIAADGSGMPDRIELRDARAGESVLLVNHEHHAVDNPFRSAHAVFIIEGAEHAAEFIDEVPPVMRDRLLSIRAFDRNGMMTDADVVEGREAEACIERMLDDAAVGYLHAHYARRGCYAALIRRFP